MDAGELTRLVAAAVESGVCDRSILERMVNVTRVEAGEVSPDSLLHTYRRRLKRTNPGSELEAATEALISFLEENRERAVVMASVVLESGGGEIFILNAEETQILHWMRMFSR
ncbi:hypothetical protein ACH4UM_02575 [Streptomyces sp. NPDC020801]|uniref:hypothetical protein n=1 Tax=Streptomyces sp. NPDC020801 TaxID=3365093 RepID=UPI0037A6F8E6